MWGLADNTNCDESDVATAGFLNTRPVSMACVSRICASIAAIY